MVQTERADDSVIETRTSRLWLQGDGILRGVLKPGADETLADAEANVAAALELSQGRGVPVLIDMRAVRAVSREARDYYGGSVPARYSRAQALLVDSSVSRVIGNFFLGLNNPPFPVRLFTSESKALQWLRGFVK